MIPYFISFISGYPSGALAANIMVSNKKISSAEANYLLYFTNNCSFQFIAGAVSYSMLGNFNLYKFIAIPHFLGALILSMLFKNNENSLSYSVKGKPKAAHFNEVFSSSISKSITGILCVGGVIVIFSIFSQFLTRALSSSELFMSLNSNYRDIIYSLLVGALEITNGCSIISASMLPLQTKLIIINFLISFSGMSITFQTMAVTTDYYLIIGNYLKARFVFGVLSALICTLMLFIL